MKIFLVSQNTNRKWDTYNSFVCIAKSAQRARVLHPASEGPGDSIMGDDYFDEYHEWVSDPKLVKVKCIGTANKNEVERIVCASYRAG